MVASMFRTISLVGFAKTCFPKMGFAVVGEPLIT
jgi:hypothetical protein